MLDFQRDSLALQNATKVFGVRLRMGLFGVGLCSRIFAGGFYKGSVGLKSAREFLALNNVTEVFCFRLYEKGLWFQGFTSREPLQVMDLWLESPFMGGGVRSLDVSAASTSRGTVFIFVCLVFL